MSVLEESDSNGRTLHVSYMLTPYPVSQNAANDWKQVFPRPDIVEWSKNHNGGSDLNISI